MGKNRIDTSREVRVQYICCFHSFRFGGGVARFTHMWNLVLIPTRKREMAPSGNLNSFCSLFG